MRVAKSHASPMKIGLVEKGMSFDISQGMPRLSVILFMSSRL